MRSVISNFPVAPRFRVRKMSFPTAEHIKEFKKEFPIYANKSEKDLRKILAKFHDNVTDEVVKNRYGVTLPFKIGNICIGACPRLVKKNIDRKISKEYLKEIQHRNFPSDGYVAKIFYTNYTKNKAGSFQDSQIWAFQGTRNFTEKVSKGFVQDFKRYIQVENFRKFADVFYKKLVKQGVYSDKINDDYNEFEI